MYVPPHNAVDDPATIHAAIRAFPLATLVTCGAGGLMANHVPLMFEANDPAAETGFGTLHGHVSIANPQWREIAAGTEVLAIFNGPDAYISPSVYATKRDTGKVVPTWNYVVVHAYGRGTTYDNDARLHALVTRLTDAHEVAREGRWAVSDAPEAYIANQLRGIVGIEIVLTRTIGKWKTSQNRSDADRAGAIADLAVSEAPAARALGAVMAEAEGAR